MLLEINESPRIISKENNISFLADFDFTYAILLSDQKLVAAFIDDWSRDLDFVGKVYDFEGNLFTQIPFPPKGVGGRQNCFWYASETSVGIWVGFHLENGRDFGGVFDFSCMQFISFNEAR